MSTEGKPVLEKRQVVNVEWQGLEEELRRVMNIYNLDAATNTPDFMLAEMLTAQLQTFRRTMRDRDKWHETGAVKS